MRRLATGVIAAIVLWGAGYPAQASSLCDKGEVAYFSCMVKGGKTVSVCGSANLSITEGYLAYRFGKPGAVELEYPKTKENSVQAFRYTSYTRAGRSDNELTFKNDTADFTVADNYEDEPEGHHEQVGIFVKLSDRETTVDLPCRGKPAVRKLWELQEIVPCAKDDARNFGCERRP